MVTDCDYQAIKDQMLEKTHVSLYVTQTLKLTGQLTTTNDDRYFFGLVHVPSSNMDGFMTHEAISHQGAIKMVWLHRGKH